MKVGVEDGAVDDRSDFEFELRLSRTGSAWRQYPDGVHPHGEAANVGRRAHAAAIDDERGLDRLAVEVRMDAGSAHDHQVLHQSNHAGNDREDLTDEISKFSN